MALDLTATYPGQIDASDPQYPQGKARNVVAEGDGTGTPWEKQIANDLLGFQQALLNQAGITPSGNPDEVGTSDYLDAIIAILSKSFAERGITNWERAHGDQGSPGASATGEFLIRLGSGGQLRGADFDPISKNWLVVGNTDGCSRSVDDGLFFSLFTGGMAAGVGLDDVAFGATSSAVIVGNGATMYQRTTVLSGAWGTVTAPGAPDALTSIVYDTTNTRFIAVGRKAGGGYATTSDNATGTAFTDRTASLPGSFATKNIGSLSVNNAGVVVAAPSVVHDKMAFSTNGGLTWSDSTTILVSGEYQLTYSQALNLFVAVRVDNETNNQVYTSPDGDVWTLKFSGSMGFDSNVGGVYQHGVAAYGIMLVVVGEDPDNHPYFVVSADVGVTWTNQLFGWENEFGATAVVSDRVNGRMLAGVYQYGLRCHRIIPG